jgi:hypothetical protein
VHFFFSDERYVPFDHPESNYQMVRKALFDRIDVPVANVHRPRTDLDDPEEAAARYEEELRNYLGTGGPGLDWVLLGLGEDGHIASLFPRSAALTETERWITVVRDSPTTTADHDAALHQSRFPGALPGWRWREGQGPSRSPGRTTRPHSFAGAVRRACGRDGDLVGG